MALSVTSNFSISAGYASNNMRNSQTMMGKSINRISSGHKAVSPADDIVSYVGGMKLKGDSKGYSMLSTGVQDAAARLNMIDSALSEIENGLLELKAQATAYATVNESSDEAKALSAAFDETKKVIQKLATDGTSKYKGAEMYLNSDEGNLNVVYGFDSTISLSVSSNTTGGVPAGVADISNIADTTNIDKAISSLTKQRATLGGDISALETISNYLANMATSADAAYTAVTEVDMAREMTSYVKNNIQSQAAQAMVAQANQGLAQVLNLLQV